jgi:hypothetical protein
VAVRGMFISLFGSPFKELHHGRERFLHEQAPQSAKMFDDDSTAKHVISMKVSFLL